MAEGYPVGKRAAPLLIALAATLLAALLLSVTPSVGAAEQQQPVIISNGSLCSGVNSDDGGEDSGCFTVGQAQPELEGFEMSVDLGSGGAFHRSLIGGYGKFKTQNSRSPNQAGCDHDKPGQRSYSCTTDAKYLPPKQQCSPRARDNPCP